MEDPSNSAAGVRAGDVLAGKYRVERVLGAGGMGVVVAAHHIQLDRRVALKFLLPHMTTSGEAVSRFAREARAAVKITSEHVARVLDVGTLETGAPFMVMEYLDGGDLAAWLIERGGLPIEQAIEFILQACVAVAEAHSLGIVHRDLKPANLFCIRRPDGQLSIKVLDFGISKLTGMSGGSEPSGMSVTKTSALMGSPLYMSPEQMRSAKSVDAQSDIWALGVILYELLARRVPFDGESLPEVAIKVATQPPPALSSIRPDVSVGLEAVILKCLEKERRDRYRNVAELALALAEFAPKRARASIERITNTIQAAGLSASALALPPSPPVIATMATATAVSLGTMAPVGQTAPGRTGISRNTRIAGGIALACVLFAGAAALLLVRVGTSRQRGDVVSSAGLAAAASSSAPSSSASLPLPVTPPQTAPLPPPLPPPSASAALPAPLAADSGSSIPAVHVGALPPVRTTTTPGVARPPPNSAASPRASALPAARPHDGSQAQGPAAGCNPPYTLDAQGNRHYKRECYLNR